MTDTGHPTRPLGRIGMQVTALGYGAMLLDPGRLTPVTEAQADTILNAVLDAGINFIDTSPDSGTSEGYFGRARVHARGHNRFRRPVAAAHAYRLPRPRRVPGDALAPRARGGAIETLRELQRAGKIRFFGAWSTSPRLNDLLAVNVFDPFQIPYSALQREHETVITDAARAGAGTVIRGGAVRGAPAPERDWSVRRLPRRSAASTRLNASRRLAEGRNVSVSGDCSRHPAA